MAALLPALPISETEARLPAPARLGITLQARLLLGASAIAVLLAAIVLGALLLPPAEALRCATLNNAEALGQADHLGAIAPGKVADLILLAPEAEQSKLMADALANLGHAFLEKSGAVESEESTSRH